MTNEELARLLANAKVAVLRTGTDSDGKDSFVLVGDTEKLDPFTRAALADKVAENLGVSKSDRVFVRLDAKWGPIIKDVAVAAVEAARLSTDDPREQAKIFLKIVGVLLLLPVAAVGLPLLFLITFAVLSALPLWVSIISVIPLGVLLGRVLYRRFTR